MTDRPDAASSVVLPLAPCGERTYSQQIELPLMVLLQQPRLVPWYRENFVNTFLFDKHFQYVGLDFQFLGFNEDIFMYYRMNLDAEEREGILHYLIKRLNQRFYAYLKVDTYYLPDSPWYEETHKYHDLLVYGYDLEQKTFHAIYFGSNGQLRPRQVSFEDLHLAVRNIPHSTNPDEGFDVTVFRLKQFFWEYPFRLERFLRSLCDYIESTDKTEESYFTSRLRESLGNTYTFGINGVRRILDHYREIGEFDFMMLHFQYEHKKGLMSSFRYIMEQYHLPADTKASMIAFEQVVSQYEKLRMLCLKSQMYADDERYRAIMARIELLLESAIQNEQTSLARIYELLSEFQKDNVHSGKIKEVADEASLSTGCTVVSSEFGWLQERYAHHFSVRYVWPAPKKLYAVELDAAGCALITRSSGETHLCMRQHEQDMTSHRLLLDPDRETEWVQIDVYSDISLRQEQIAFRAYEVDLAYKKPCTASGYWDKEVKCPPSNAVNRVEGNHWSAAHMSADGEYIEVDLQESTPINTVIWRQRMHEDVITAYRCRCLTADGWVTVAEYDGPLFGRKVQHLSFEKLEATRVRLEFLATQPNENGVAEPGVEHLRVYLL